MASFAKSLGLYMILLLTDFSFAVALPQSSMEPDAAKDSVGPLLALNSTSSMFPLNVSVSQTLKEDIGTKERISSESHIQQTLSPYSEQHPTEAGSSVIDAPHLEDFPSNCTLHAVDAFTYDRIKDLLGKKVKLIEYKLIMVNYTNNPFYENITFTYKPDIWNRITSRHGQTLLSLAFNFGVLSLQTLTMGTIRLDVELYDMPRGCFVKLGENQRISALVDILVRDFKEASDEVLEGGERVCHEVIVPEGGTGKFKDSCCYRPLMSNKIKCVTHVMNIWLSILHNVLIIIRFSVLFFGPLMFIPIVESLAEHSIPYVVKLKEPFLKTICVARSDTLVSYRYKHLLDFRALKRLYKLRRSALNIPLGEAVKVKISQYDISVDYNILQPENQVPVGLIECLARTICGCQIRQVSPFKTCCNANMFHTCPNRSPTPVPWIKLWEFIGRLLIIIFIPIPFYLRLLLYYCWEKDELESRREALARMGLPTFYESSLIHYLTPVHPILIAMYINYFMSALAVAYMASRDTSGRFLKIITGSFADLKAQSWTRLLGIIVSNMIWPFKRYGMAGCLVVPIYWPIVILFNLVFCIFTFLPTVYMTTRMLFYSRDAVLNKNNRKPKRKGGYQVEGQSPDFTHIFELDDRLGTKDSPDGITDLNILEIGSQSRRSQSRTSLSTVMTIVAENRGQKCRRMMEHLIASILLITTLCSCLFVLSDCVGCIVEITVFTLMGLIVNAGSVLKYAMLLLLVLIYSYDCFNNVPKKYLKLNKALFGEIKGRCRDLETVTSLPSTLQENFGFKSQELSEQAEYESPDDVSEDQPRQWLINDLTLFVDSEDTPRIPHKLFEDVCQVRVSGAPGPVYQSLIDAGKQFLVILIFLFFVFLIVLSFGAIYEVSSTNQMIATAAGGFLPMILRSFMTPSRPDIEIGTVSFKSKLDEIIKNFYQIWPIYDFPFDVPTKEEIKEMEGEADEKTEEETGQDNKTDIIDEKVPFDTKREHNNTVSFGGINLKEEKTRDNRDAPTDTIEEVDILIYLPQKYNDTWLEEWSDIGDYEADNNDVFEEVVVEPNNE